MGKVGAGYIDFGKTIKSEVHESFGGGRGK